MLSDDQEKRPWGCIVVCLLLGIVLLGAWALLPKEPSYPVLFVFKKANNVEVKMTLEDLKDKSNLLAELESLGLARERISQSVFEKLAKQPKDRDKIATAFQTAFNLPVSNSRTQGTAAQTLCFTHSATIVMPTPEYKKSESYSPNANPDAAASESTQTNGAGGNHTNQNERETDKRTGTHVQIFVHRHIATVVLTPMDPDKWGEWVKKKLKLDVNREMTEELEKLKHTGDLFGEYRNRGEIALHILLQHEAAYLAKKLNDRKKSVVSYWAEKFGTINFSEQRKFDERKFAKYDETYIEWIRLLIAKRKGDKVTDQLNRLEALAEGYLAVEKGKEVPNGQYKGYQVDGSILSLAEYSIIVLYLEQYSMALNGCSSLPEDFNSESSEGRFYRIAKLLTACIEKREAAQAFPTTNYFTKCKSKLPNFIDSISPNINKMKYTDGLRPNLVGGRLLYFALKACMELDSPHISDEEVRRQRAAFWLNQALVLKQYINTRDMDSYKLCYLKRASAVLMCCSASVQAHSWAVEWKTFSDSLTSNSNKWSKFYKPLSNLGYLLSVDVFIAQETKKLNSDESK